MKTIAALIAGLLLSMMTFVAGIAIALVYLDIRKEPPRSQNLDTAALWTTEPASVEKQTLTFERLPARPAPRAEVASLNKNSTEPALDPAIPADQPVADDPMAMVDPVTTGAIDPAQTDAEPAPRAEQSVAHVEWCSRRYRSYRSEDNSYRPYGGGRRTCESPYSDTAAAAWAPDDASPNGDPETRNARDDIGTVEDAGQFERAAYEEASDASLSGDHIESCMSRYRSYRPEDNTYQPFDGGPRRQCE